MVLAEPRRAEDGHARADEVQRTEAANEIVDGAEDQPQLLPA
jgi:hypothetical protein